MASDGEGNYATQVQSFSDEELVLKERSKRRRKTGDVVGTGLSAAAAMGSPALWAVAGASAKSYLDNSSKHKIILAEMKRRGLEPEKGDMSDTLWPILTSVGTTAVGRAFGGSAGQGIASQAGNLVHTVSNRAFGGSSTSSKKDKQSKKVPTISESYTDYLKSKTPAQGPAMISAAQPQQAQALQQSAVSYAQPVRTLQTPSAYQVPANQAPPATLVYQYVPPSAQYPQGCYAPVLSQQTPTQAAPVATTSPPPYQQSQQQFGQPPALNYVNSPAQPQYYQNQPQPGLNRSQTFYSPGVNTHTTLGRANTVAYM
jgi:hypothetical protein